MAGLLAAGCGTIGTTGPAAVTPAPRALALDIAPGKFAEECFRIAAGERIEYRFESGVALGFNIHTHRGSEVVMPVEIASTREQSGTFTAPQAGDYCMMWTNPGVAPARLNGQWRRMP